MLFCSVNYSIVEVCLDLVRRSAIEAANKERKREEKEKKIRSFDQLLNFS